MLASPLGVALGWLALLGLAAGLVWWLYRQPPQVELTRQLPPNGFQGRQIPLQVRLRVRSVLPVRVVLEDPLPRSVVPDIAPVLSGMVQGQAESAVSTRLTLNRRGAYSWPGATLHWADPLGLFWRRVSLSEPPATLEVFPAVHGLVLPDLLRPLLSEGALARTLGLEDPISLRGAREYAPGDPPGRIHWRLSARTGTLTVRELERTAASSLVVYLDLYRASEVFTESAVRLAASLLHEAAGLDLPVAIATNAGCSRGGRGTGSLETGLLALAHAAPHPEPPRIPPIPAGSNLLILTAAGGDELLAQAMRARGTASRVSIVAIPEGFYLEPGENPRRQWAGVPQGVRDLQRQAGALAGAGVLVYVLRGNQSVLKLAAE